MTFGLGKSLYIKPGKKPRSMPCWTIREFSELKGIECLVMIKWVKNSDLKPALSKGKRYYYQIQDLNEWFDSLQAIKSRDNNTN